LRSSPGGGGGGSGVARLASTANPTLRMTHPATTATATASTLALVSHQASTPETTSAARVGSEIFGRRRARVLTRSS
jgi:hypothetical protein